LKSEVTAGTIGSAICTEQIPDGHKEIKLVGWVSVETDCGAEEWDGGKENVGYKYHLRGGV